MAEALIGAVFLEDQGSLRLPLLVLDKIGLRLPHAQEVECIAKKAGQLDPDSDADRLDDTKDIGGPSWHTALTGMPIVSKSPIYTPGGLIQLGPILGCDMSKCGATCRVRR